MRWIKKYGWLIFIGFLAGMMGNVFCSFIERIKNWGSVADWVSGILSFAAITIALKQVNEQKEQYEDDKKTKREDDILKNRAFFDVSKRNYVVKNRDSVWVSKEDRENKKAWECIYNKFNDKKAEENKKVLECIYNKFNDKKAEENKKALECIYNKFNDKKAEDVKYTLEDNSYIYVFRNLTKASAYSCTFKIEYMVNDESEYDYIQTNIGIMSGEEICLLPSKLINNPNKYANCQKKVSIYFETFDKKIYCQTWLEEKFEKEDIIDFEYEDITIIKRSEKPKKGHAVFLAIS